MDKFIYQYPVRQYFGKGCAEEAIRKEMKNAGENILLAYGCGSLRRTGLYDKIRSWLEECGKNVIDFGGIMPNPTYAKVQEGARLVREKGIDFLAVGGGSVIDCCKIVSAQAKLDEDIWDMWYVHTAWTSREYLPTATSASMRAMCRHLLGKTTEKNDLPQFMGAQVAYVYMRKGAKSIDTAPFCHYIAPA